MAQSRVQGATPKTYQLAGALPLGQLDLAHAPLANGLYEGIVARRGGDDGAVSVLGPALRLWVGGSSGSGPCGGGSPVTTLVGAVVLRGGRRGHIGLGRVPGRLLRRG